MQKNYRATLGSATLIGQNLREDGVEHDLGLCLAVRRDASDSPEHVSYAFAVVDTETGLVEGWDGWYFSQTDAAITDLATVKVRPGSEYVGPRLLEASSKWAIDTLGRLICRRFDPEHEAAAIVYSHGQSIEKSESPRFAECIVAAYVPMRRRHLDDHLRSLGSKPHLQ